jgi:hypothetical protein
MNEITNLATAELAFLLEKAQRRVADAHNRLELRQPGNTVRFPDGSVGCRPTPEYDEAFERWEAAKAKLMRLYRETVVASDLPGDLVREVLLARVAHAGAKAWCKGIAAIPGAPDLDLDRVKAEVSALRTRERERVSEALRVAIMLEDEEAADRRGQGPAN